MSEFPADVRLRPIGRDGKRAVLASVTDVSERKRAQERQQLIVRELHHRTRNIFSAIQFILVHSVVSGRPEVQSAASARAARRGLK